MTAARRRFVLVAVLGLVLSGCLFYEQPLTARFTCFPLEDGQSYGRSRELDVDIQQFSRPGLFTAEEVDGILDPLGVEADGADHIARIVGPCGETDLFVRVTDGEHCITVVAHSWSDHVCRAFDGPTVFPLDLGEMEGHATLVVVGPDVDHVRAESEGFTIGGFPIDGHIVVSSPQPLSEPVLVRTGEG